MNNSKPILASRIKIARIFFIISALYGLTLRLYSIVDFIPVAYKNILQAHSHVTFLGWGFLAVISIIGYLYYPNTFTTSKYQKNLFYLMTFTLFGMLISFPLQGYKVFSIVFLSVFLITSYLYLISTLKSMKPIKSWSVKYVRTGIYYYFLSSIAIWAVAIITVRYGKIDLYFNLVYFYLHFLYNGFFVLVLFGLLIKYFENKQINFNNIVVKQFYWFTNIAIIPAYTLSLLWMNFVPNYLYYIGFIAMILQLISLYYLFDLSKTLIKSIKQKDVKYIAYFVLISYFIKIIFQFLSVFPIIMEKIVQYKSYLIIGYLHLFTLGFMSMFIILLLRLHPEKKLNKFGINLLMLGILLSELLLFLQAVLLHFFDVSIPNLKLLLFIVSALMPLGLLIVHFKLFFKQKAKTI